MYSLIYSQDAVKQLKKLDKDLQERILSSLERCRFRPYSHVKKIIGSRYYRLRVGDYRIIMDIQGDKLRIFVIKIGHRKKIYK